MNTELNLKSRIQTKFGEVLVSTVKVGSGVVGWYETYIFSVGKEEDPLGNEIEGILYGDRLRDAVIGHGEVCKKYIKFNLA